MGHYSLSHQWDVHRHSMFLLTPVQVKGTDISLRVLHKNLLHHRQVREARVWVEVRDRAHRSGLQGPRGVSTSLHHKLSLQINRLYKVCFCYLVWARILFDSSASHSFIVTSCVKELGLEVETLEKSLHVSSPLGTRVSVDLICRDCELEISIILLTVDLRVMDMSEFNVILKMDWLTAHRVIIDCDRRRVTAYTHDGVCVVFQRDKHSALPQTVYDSRWHGQLMGCLASLTMKDKKRQGLSLPRVVFEFKGVFPDDLSTLPPNES